MFRERMCDRCKLSHAQCPCNYNWSLDQQVHSLPIALNLSAVATSHVIAVLTEAFGCRPFYAV